MSRRTDKRAWSAAGLEILARDGHNALTVERVCTALEKTKGSFYHHFADIDAFHEDVLALWETELTDAPISASMEEREASARGAKLDAVVRVIDHTLDLAVRAWASSNPHARDALARVDERRVAYLASLHRAAGHKNARLLAELDYAGFVGAQQLGYFADAKRAARLGRAMRKALALLGEA